MMRRAGKSEERFLVDPNASELYHDGGIIWELRVQYRHAPPTPDRSPRLHDPRRDRRRLPRRLLERRTQKRLEPGAPQHPPP